VTAVEPGDEAEQVFVSELKRKALTGSAFVALRGAIVALLALGATVLLTRNLSAADFGIASLGISLATAAAIVSEVGLGAGLIRRVEPPMPEELRAVGGAQLLAALALIATVALIGLPFGRIGAVAASMLACLPLLAFRTPGMITLERELKYRQVAQIEVGEALAYVVALVPTVLAGGGVWAVVLAVNLRFASGVALMAAIAPEGVVRPSFEFRRLRSLVRFGLHYQAVTLATVAQTQCLNLGVAAIGGVLALATWSVTYRLLQVPFLLFRALWRVSFPSISALNAKVRDVGSAIEEGARLVSIATAFILVPLAAGSPALVPEIFGAGYRDAGLLILPFCLGLQFSGPVSVALGGFLFARGEARTVLKAIIADSLAWLAIAFALLPTLGTTAIGIGFLAGAAIESLIFTGAAASSSGIRIGRKVLPPLALAIATAAAGLGLSFALGESYLGGLTGALLALLAYSVLQFALDSPSRDRFRRLIADLRGAG
jgi:O-antigen/teichoic acid export membrane protein